MSSESGIGALRLRAGALGRVAGFGETGRRRMEWLGGLVALAVALTALPGVELAKGQDSRGATVRTGLEVLAERGYDLLEGRRVGLITNATGVDSRLRSTVDRLHEAPGVELVALYGPEHGVRGDVYAGEKVESGVDPATGVPVFSLYGATRKPTPEMLEGVDVLVFDIQDIGVRSYTYIATMGLAMEAAAENGIDFVVLDRPNPLGGLQVEGGLVRDGFESFVSPYPIPYRYGLTAGELARMIAGEGWLEGGAAPDLHVVAMKGWNRAMTFEQTGLPWVPTSPHIPHAASPYHYVASGIMGELGVFSEGVGYTLPFEVFAAEWLDGGELARRMNALDLPGVRFRPITFRPYYGRDQGKTLHGVQVHVVDPVVAQLVPLQFWFMQVHHEMHPDVDVFGRSTDRWRMFDRVNGTDEIRERFARRYRVADIEDLLMGDVSGFARRSAPYRLY